MDRPFIQIAPKPILEGKPAHRLLPTNSTTDESGGLVELMQRSGGDMQLTGEQVATDQQPRHEEADLKIALLVRSAKALALKEIANKNAWAAGCGPLNRHD